ncbi:hypothetical protein GCM10022225_79970 [Plantactinospora mayteni]|uniref:Uncharacterized protein n=1 Tax=Plantactinospora mayteni TaxID=566021 RepID=A0ABQ4F352_9ACTN|nr:hypothetical protein [Plantactinospora mayteni]GIH01346.1 hypothetical protein Pma05_79180 [Plantactinospora mayteni]
MAGVLNELLKQGEAFDSFRPGEQWKTDYAIWYPSISGFRMFYGLEEFSIRDVNKYLWMLGGERTAMGAGLRVG